MLPQSFWFRALFQTGLSPITILDIILLFVFLCVSRINSLFVFFSFAKKVITIALPVLLLALDQV